MHAYEEISNLVTRTQHLNAMKAPPPMHMVLELYLTKYVITENQKFRTKLNRILTELTRIGGRLSDVLAK